MLTPPGPIIAQSAYFANSSVFGKRISFCAVSIAQKLALCYTKVNEKALSGAKEGFK